MSSSLGGGTAAIISLGRRCGTLPNMFAGSKPEPSAKLYRRSYWKSVRWSIGVSLGHGCAELVKHIRLGAFTYLWRKASKLAASKAAKKGPRIGRISTDMSNTSKVPAPQQSAGHTLDLSKLPPDGYTVRQYSPSADTCISSSASSTSVPPSRGNFARLCDQHIEVWSQEHNIFITLCCYHRTSSIYHWRGPFTRYQSLSLKLRSFA